MANKQLLFGIVIEIPIIGVIIFANSTIAPPLMQTIVRIGLSHSTSKASINPHDNVYPNGSARRVPTRVMNYRDKYYR